MRAWTTCPGPTDVTAAGLAYRTLVLTAWTKDVLSTTSRLDISPGILSSINQGCNSQDQNSNKQFHLKQDFTALKFLSTEFKHRTRIKYRTGQNKTITALKVKLV